MEAKNYSLESKKSVVHRANVFSTIQKYIHEKTDGLNLFEKIMLTLYSLMTLFFLLSALYFVFTKGFKY